WIGAIVAIVMLIVTASYRYQIRAYPDGDYRATASNLGARPAIIVGSALMVDHVLTVAVAAAAATATIGSVFAPIGTHPVWTAVGIVVFVGLLHLRGQGRASRLVTSVVYLFIAVMITLLVVGVVGTAAGTIGTTAGVLDAPEMTAELSGMA